MAFFSRSWIVNERRNKSPKYHNQLIHIEERERERERKLGMRKKAKDSETLRMTIGKDKWAWFNPIMSKYKLELYLPLPYPYNEWHLEQELVHYFTLYIHNPLSMMFFFFEIAAAATLFEHVSKSFSFNVDNSLF